MINCPIVAIEGYAAIFNEADLNGDRIVPGAFKKSLAAQGRAPIKMLYQHNVDAPIGVWRSFREDARGLYGRGEIYLMSQTAREAVGFLKAGVIDGLSIGFRAVKARTIEGLSAENGPRKILEAELWEVSIVTFPMAPHARVARIGDQSNGVVDGLPVFHAPANDDALFAEAINGAAHILSAATQIQRKQIQPKQPPSITEYE